MKVVILAGGFGERLGGETHIKPKSLINIGNKPILWHLMKIYSNYGFNEFIILLGYKGHLIKEYFSNYFLYQNDVTVDIEENRLEIHEKRTEPWKVTLLETGLNTMTGGRIKYAEKFVGDGTFLLTYGDAVADINILESVEFHKKHGKTITVTAVRPEERFGALKIDNDGAVTEFKEKPVGVGDWINGGFFICEPKIFSYINGDETIFEKEPLSQLAIDGQLVAFKHNGFWQCMDTFKDKEKLCQLWNANDTPWKTW